LIVTVGNTLVMMLLFSMCYSLHVIVNITNKLHLFCSYSQKSKTIIPNGLTRVSVVGISIIIIISGSRSMIIIIADRLYCLQMHPPCHIARFYLSDNEVHAAKLINPSDFDKFDKFDNN